MSTILLIRHANTTYDKKVDALLDPPLTREGVERISRTIEFVKSRGFKFSKIVTSPLQRAKRPAEMLADNNARVYPNRAAAPWDLGDIMGREDSKVADQLEYLKNYPDIKAPHGESYRTFYNRWTAFLGELMRWSEGRPNEDIVVVTHSRNINALQSFIGGNPVGDVEETTKEASVTQLSSPKMGSEDWTCEVIWEGK